MPLKNKVAVVTGATGALGRVVTKILLENGAYVVSTYRNEGNKLELIEFLDDLKHNLIGVETDVTSEKSVQILFQKTIEKHGRIDILLNIVDSYMGSDEIADTKESDWEFMMNVNRR